VQSVALKRVTQIVMSVGPSGADRTSLSPLLFLRSINLITQRNVSIFFFDPEDGGSAYVRNVDNAASIQKQATAQEQTWHQQRTTMGLQTRVHTAATVWVSENRECVDVTAS
jgi:hypothetical protein